MRNLIDLISEDLETIFEDTNDLRSDILKRLEKIASEDDLQEILKFVGRYAIKKDVEKFATLRQYKDIVSNVFLQALADANVSEKEVKSFLKKLSTDGILNEKLLVTPRNVHSYEDLIDPKFKDIFDAIKTDLFQKMSGKIGELGDVGKGEYMLDIISPHVNRRGAPGDLDISGIKIELKAGENGRLGPAGSMSLAGRFEKEFIPVIQKLVPGKVRQAKNPVDFNLRQNMAFFSEFFGTAKNVKIALAWMLQMHYPSYDTKSMVEKIVGTDGEIDGNELKKEMLKASYTVYKEAKGFDGIIIMDLAITKFLYVKNPSDIVAVADALSAVYPSWTDQQSNTVKVTLKLSAPPGSVTGKAAPATKEKEAVSKKISDIAAGKATTKLKPKAAPAGIGRARR